MDECPALGNLTSASDGRFRTISYTSFNLPDANTGIQGASGSPQYRWSYDENHARIQERRTNANGTRTTWTLNQGLGFELEELNGAYQQRHHLSAGGQTFGVLVAAANTPSLASDAREPSPLGSIALARAEFWQHDHLGSVSAITDHTGAVLQRLAYDPFGKRRNTNGSYDEFGTIVMDWSAQSGTTDRGFTGHEHLDDIGLVHMNGRIFNPTLATFMQADPFVQDPGNLQNYNRYAYCFNNPLGCTDPSGYFSLRRAHALGGSMGDPACTSYASGPWATSEASRTNSTSSETSPAKSASTSG